jgi:drug/metabolite transporter (DMT)-like permease
MPVAWGLARGESPSVLASLGIALAIGAGGLIAVEGGVKGTTAFAQGATQAVVAGIAFGSSLVLYSSTPSSSGQWPVLTSRVGAFVAASVALTVARRSRVLTMPSGSARTYALAAGVVDVTGTSLLVIAVRHNLLVVVAPVVALAPAFTVVLARVLGGERLRAVQRFGLLVALVGLILIAA